MPPLPAHSRSHVSTSPRVGLRQSGHSKSSRYRDDECNRSYPHSRALMNATALGSSPTENEPSGCPRLPPVDIRYAVILLSLPVTYKNAPDGSTARNIGEDPLEKGEPAIGVSAPFEESMVNPETSFEKALEA